MPGWSRDSLCARRGWGPRGPQGIGACLVVLALCRAPAAQAGSHAGSITVSRDGGTESCPGSDELTARVERILQRSIAEPEGAALEIEVVFHRDQDEWSAEVRVTGPVAGTRTLRDRGATCQPLGDAVSVALSLLLDGQATEVAAPAESPPPSPVPPAAAPSPRADPVASDDGTPAGRRRSPAELHAALGLGSSIGFGGPYAPVGSLQLGIRRGRWLMEGGFTGSWPTRTAYAGGTVEVGLHAANLRGCGAFGGRAWLAPCLELGLGRLIGRGRGYEESQRSALTWSAGGLTLTAHAPLAHSLFLATTTTLWIPFGHDSFSVQNSGVAYSAPPVGALGTLGLGWTCRGP